MEIKRGLLGLSILLLFFAQATIVDAQDYPENFDPSFSAEALPHMILSDEDDAIVRLDEQFFDVKNIGKATLTVHRAVTILNEGARDEGEFYVVYDKLRTLKKIEGVVRNAKGKVVRKLDKEDMDDYSAVSGFSLYEDNRVRVAGLYHNEYPYTVEYTIVLDLDGLLFWDPWSPLGSELPLEYGRYEVTVPEGMPVRYKVVGMELAPQISQSGRKTTYRWELSYLHMFKELLIVDSNQGLIAPAVDDVTVHVAPEEFEIEGSRGDMRSWETFSTWYYSLGEGRDVLPGDVRNRIRSITSGIQDPVEKVKKVYEEFQATTRYVSVQLGLGGWQPYDAMYVAENGYGDCKALTNYLYALLKEAGIRSYPALIESGRFADEILEDFPSNQFNHVVLMVPMPADTLWLEATDQTAPFNHLGVANEDRYALVVRPDNGELVRTPQTSSARNRRFRTSSVRLTGSGYATAEVEAKYTGNRQDYIRHNLVKASGREQMDWLRNVTDIPSFDITSADFTAVQGRQAEIKIPFSLDLPRYASKSGKRLFVPTNLFRTTVSVPEGEYIPNDPVKLAYAYADEEDVLFALPAGYTVEAMPENVEFETPFSVYRATHTQTEEGAVEYKRTIEFKTRVIQPAMYGEYRDFLKKVARADRSQIVLVAQP
ncbi:MAG: DUF3857 domain-containing protein [Rhodothermaceae bacterium]|nr:DUF3857 domain-containing protein [Rhodothermaceae bacterium]